MDSRLRAAGAGVLYFVIVFAAGFAFGTMRTLFLVPQVGDVAAVSIEAPLILGVSWVAARFCVRHLSVSTAATSRLGLGPNKSIVV